MTLAYMGVPDRCEHGEYQDRGCPLCEVKRLRDAVAFLRGHVQQNAGGGGQSFAYVWQSVWDEFERRLNS